MVRFEWDPVKASANGLKHGINFDDAMQVFDDGRNGTIIKHLLRKTV